MRPSLWLWLVLVACGGHPSPLPQHRGGEGPPALFAALFDSGKAWKLSLDVVHRHTIDPDDPGETTHGTLTCRVGSVDRVKTAWVAKITCEGDDDSVGHSSRPDGWYVATAAGLWRPAAWAGDPASLDPAAMWLDAHPRPGVFEDNTPDKPVWKSTAVVEHAGGWCVTETILTGDASDRTLCIRGDVGLLGGSAVVAGGITTTASWGDVPRH